jgi:Rhs element Vgr protein
MNNDRTITGNSATDVATFTILSGGTEVSRSYQLMSIDVAWELNRVPSATLVFRDGEAASGNFEISNKTNFEPGKEIEIKAGYRSNEDTIFKGIVIRHSLKIRESSSLLFVECRDKAVKMTVGERSKYFTEQKDSEIMEAVIGAAGLQAEVEATQVKHPEVVQYHSTDWDFLLTRADLTSQLVFVENGKVKTAKPQLNQEPVLSAVFGSSLLEFDAEIDARDSFKSVKALGWDAANQEIAESESQSPPNNDQGNLSADTLAQVIDLEALTLRHPAAVQKPELQNWANARMQKSRLAKVRGRAKFQGTAQIKPGSMVKLEGVGKRFNGKVFVAGVRHQIGNGNWHTDVQFGMDPTWFAARVGLAGASGNGLFPTVPGLQTGVVTALESDPAGEDRIQVRLPLVSPDATGTWCRLSTLDAGDGRGSYFRPEIGDEVTVGFLGGDPRHPVVLGMLHSSAKPSPVPASDDNHLKGFVSRSEMKWTFDDEKKVITFETPGGNKIVLSDEDSGITLEDQNGNKIVMNSSGIELSSASDIKVTATAKAEVGGATLVLAGQSSTELKASGSLKVEASGIAEIKGSLVKLN